MDTAQGSPARELTRARLDAFLAIEFMTSLWDLIAELVHTREQMARSSEVASRHDEALVRWTRVLSWATWAYTVLTGGLLVAAVVALLRR